MLPEGRPDLLLCCSAPWTVCLGLLTGGVFFVFLFFFLNIIFFSLFYSNLEVMLGVWRHWEDSTSSLNWGVCCRVLRTRKPQNLFCFSSFLRKLVYLIKCDSFLFFCFSFFNVQDSVRINHKHATALP